MPRLKATGFALTDGTPLKAVEVRVDEGPWKPAVLDKRNTPYSWQLFTLRVDGRDARRAHDRLARDRHRAALSKPTDAELAAKKTRWENNGQFVRKFKVA